MWDYIIPRSPKSSLFRQKENREMTQLIDIVNNKKHITDIYRTLDPKKEYILFSGHHRTFFKIDHILDTKQVSNDVRKLK